MTTTAFDPTIDSYMEGVATPNSNYGSETIVQIGALYLGGPKTFLWRGIGNFDVSSVAGLTILSATLELQFSTTGAAFLSHLARCTRPSTWTSGGVTWNKYDGSNAWTNAGGDWDAATPAEIGFNVPAGSGLLVISGLKTFVDDAIANRANIVSLILRADDEAPGVSDYSGWNSKEGSPVGWRLKVVTPGGGFNMRNYW